MTDRRTFTIADPSQRLTRMEVVHNYLDHLIDAMGSDLEDIALGVPTSQATRIADRALCLYNIASEFSRELGDLVQQEHSVLPIIRRIEKIAA